MIFKYRETGPLQVNCYIVGDEQTREAVVIDPGGDAEAILYLLKEDDLTLKSIINTHSHFDHVGGNATLKRETGAEILIHQLEKEMLPAMSGLARQWGIPFEQSPPADKTIDEGDVIEIGSIKLDAILTPGHSPGSLTFKIRDMPMAIVGDVLFQYGVGRTDFPGGSHALLIKSIREKLLPMGDDTEVYPGHGPPTVMGRERKFNPFLQEDGGPEGGSNIIIP